jgi:CheY-like chemotaxis protein
MRRPSSWAEAEAHLPGPETQYARTTGFSAKLGLMRLSASEQRVLTLVDGKNALNVIAERSGIVAKEVARILHRLAAVDLIAAPVHRPSSRRSGMRPVMILEPDREGFHSPLRALLQNRPEPLELVDLAGEPDLLIAITREHPALVILNDAACDANVGDVARAIRATPKLANVSLAAVLESRAKAKMDDLAAAGFDAVLVKPVLYSDLSKLIASSFMAQRTGVREGETHEDSRRG